MLLYTLQPGMADVIEHCCLKRPKKSFLSKTPFSHPSRPVENDNDQGKFLKILHWSDAIAMEQKTTPVYYFESKKSVFFCFLRKERVFPIPACNQKN